MLVTQQDLPLGIQLCLVALLSLEILQRVELLKRVTLKIDIGFLFCLAEEWDPLS